MTDAEKYEDTKALLMDIYKEFAYGKSYPNDCSCLESRGKSTTLWTRLNFTMVGRLVKHKPQAEVNSSLATRARRRIVPEGTAHSAHPLLDDGHSLLKQ